MNVDPRPLVMILNGACWPGNDASGPNRSLRALAVALDQRFRFHLVARDRPFAARKREASKQTEPGFARCTYGQPGLLRTKALIGAIEAAKPDLIWLNGFHDHEFTLPVLFARRLRRLRGIPVLLSPRGEFASGALGLKKGRKTVYRMLACLGRLLNGVSIHATSDAEGAEVRAGLPWHRAIEHAPNLSALPALRERAEKQAGKPLEIVFLGRIARVKNLDFALRVLARVASPVRFHIVGPVQDETLWQECRTLIAALPPHIRTVVHGSLPHGASLDRLARADLLFLPSRSENFGHAIFEALGSGVPVLISDGTPWRNLEEARAGFDLPLDSPEPFAVAIERIAGLGDLTQWRHGARALAEHHAATSDAVAINAALLERLVGRPS